MTCHNTLKPQNGLLFEFLKKFENLKAEALFHTKRNLLCLVCRRVVSFSLCSAMYFSLSENMGPVA